MVGMHLQPDIIRLSYILANPNEYLISIVFTVFLTFTIEAFDTTKIFMTLNKQFRDSSKKIAKRTCNL